MVRILVDHLLADGKHCIEAAGNSADSKPATNIVTGSLFLEVNTGDVYAFEEGDSAQWDKIAALGGGT